MNIYLLLCCNAHDGGTRDVLHDGHIKHERLMVHMAEARGLDGAQGVTIKFTSITWRCTHVGNQSITQSKVNICYVFDFKSIHLRRTKGVLSELVVVWVGTDYAPCRIDELL